MNKSGKKSGINIYRNKIDQIDLRIIKLLTVRFKLSEKIAVYKKKQKLTLVQKQREKEVINKIILCNESKHLRKMFIRALFHLIFNESINHQKKIISNQAPLTKGLKIDKII